MRNRIEVDSHLSYEQALSIIRSLEDPNHRNGDLMIILKPSRFKTLSEKTLDLLNKAGVKIETRKRARGRPSNMTQAFLFNLISLKKSFSLRELGKIFGTSHNTIWYYLRNRSEFPVKLTDSKFGKTWLVYLFNELTMITFAEFCEREGWPRARVTKRCG